MYINILFIIIMIVLILLIAKQKELSKTLKSFVIGLSILVIALAMLFEYTNTASEKKSRPVINAFKEGKPLICAKTKITQKTYSYEPGTATFQPRLNIVGDTFNVKECTQK